MSEEVDVATFLTRKERFYKYFRPGTLHIVCGQPGMGKSTFAMMVLNAALERYGDDYVVCSNILLKHKARRADGSIVVEQAYPKGYYLVTSWAHFAVLLPTFLEQGKRIILCMDEGGMAESAQAGSTVLQAATRDFNSLLTIRRKLNLCLIIIAIDVSVLQGKLREVGGIVNAIWEKVHESGYDEKEVVEVRSQTKTKLFKGVVPHGIATPEPQVKLGQIYMETEAPAMFDAGRLRGKPFLLGEFLRAASNCLKEEVPSHVRAFLKSGKVVQRSPIPEIAAYEIEEAESDDAEPLERREPQSDSTQHNVKDQVDTMLRENYPVPQIVKTVVGEDGKNVSKQFVYQRKKELAL